MNRVKRDVRIGPRLTAAFLAVALLALASGLIGLVGFQRASRAAAILVQDAEMIQSIQEIRIAAAVLPLAPSEYLLNGDGTARARYRAAIDATRARLAEFVAVHQHHQHSVQHAASAQALTAETENHVDRIALLETEIFDGNDPVAGAVDLAELESLVTSITSSLDLLLQYATEDIETAQTNHAAAERSAYIGLTASAILAIGLALGLAVAFTRSISLPLAQLAKAADLIAGGDLSSPVSIKAPGEIGRLADAFERMRQTLVRERGQLRLLAVLEERDRIGREMHDGLAQVLGYVNAKAQAISEFLRSGAPDVAERQIEELVAAAREAYTDAREVIVGLRMDGVDQRTLTAMLSEYVEQFVRQNEIDTVLNVGQDWDERRLEPTARVQLLRIVQEALTNVRKHASASSVQITLDRDDQQALIRIKDDGRGFNLSLLLRPDYARYGLRTMRERAHAIGGKFRIESLVGSGTCITVLLSLEQDREKQL